MNPSIEACSVKAAGSGAPLNSPKETLTSSAQPRLAVFTTLFPHAGEPTAGLFIRERMFRVGRKIPLVVVAPRPWFPAQRLIRFWWPHYRPSAPSREMQQGFNVYRPRFLAVPGLFRGLDGLLMALGSYPAMRRLKRQFGYSIIDAHFAYPEGYAATLLGQWLQIPVTITLRGTEVPMSRTSRRRQIYVALQRASRVFTVSNSLRELAVDLGADASKITVVANGVDTDKFQPVPRHEARQALGIDNDAKVLITVGGLTERKGFHRVIELLPRLRESFPNIMYLIVGGGSAAGDWRARLQQIAYDLNVEGYVRFLGAIAPEKLKVPLSAADVFVLSTTNEGWANVILESMACATPVVATDVGGNREAVSSAALGIIVPFGNAESLYRALVEALARDWDARLMVNYARANTWDKRVKVLVSELCEIGA